MNGSNSGFGTGSPAGDPFFGEYATLNTNTDPTNATLGLKDNSSFTVSGLFDLISPQDDRNEYGIRLTDRTATQAGDDVVELRLTRGADGIEKVQLREIDFASGTRTVLQSIDLDPGSHDQILLSLTNDVAHPGVVHASFQLEQGGVLDASTLTTFTATGTIFDNENWTRAQFFAEAPAQSDSVLQGTYGQLDITQTGAWTYQLANGQANVQALAAGQTVQDIFTVQVADGHGGTDTKTITVNVTGTNDAAVIGGPTVHDVTEDANVVNGNLTASGTIAISDADQNQAFFQTGVTGAAGNLGSLALSANASYTDTFANPVPHALAIYNIMTVQVAVRPGEADSKTITVNVTGTNDAAVIGNPTVHDVTEDTNVANGNLTAIG